MVVFNEFNCTEKRNVYLGVARLAGWPGYNRISFPSVKAKRHNEFDKEIQFDKDVDWTRETFA